MTTALLTDEAARRRIHEALDETLFVEAGAGTGKTRELIERLLALVATGRAELRTIAAITFTDAAAIELRDRVRLRLEEAAHDDELSSNERERCAAAVAQLDQAPIETLHAFAQRILAEHPLEAGLPPALEVQDEIRSSIAFDERWTAFLDELLADGALEEVLLRAFALGLDVKDLRKAAWELHQHWDRLEDVTIEPAPLPPIDVSLLLARLNKACETQSRCVDHDDRLFALVERVAHYRDRLSAATTDLDRLRLLAERMSLRPTKRIGQSESWRGVAPADVRRLLEDAQAARDELLRGARASVLPALLAALRNFILHYATERRQQGRLEFHDLLVQARDLLRRDAGVRDAVRARFTHLLIDEFQDTDPLQIEIAALIAAKETDGVTSRWQDADIDEGRLFFVGDPKQSIYRFRRADIELYQRAQHRFSTGVTRLTQNFRSVAPVIGWVNSMFEQIMAGDAGQVPYLPLDASRQSDRAGTTVRLLGAPSAGNIGPIREREAAELARLIASIKAGGWLVHDGDLARAARYDDIALLMPTRTTLPPIEDALEAAGIPYRVESRSLVYDSQEVRDLLSILRAVDDPTDEVALIAALRSPAFACGDDDLLRYSQAGGRWDYRYETAKDLPAGDPVVSALAALHDLHRRRWWETISGMVEAVIRERRLFELAFAHHRPRERWQRLRFVLDQARAFAEAGGRTLRQFIEWAERQADEGTRVVETVVPEPDDDAVRVMTIHAAKGLEFPIVILAGLNIEDGQQRKPRSVLWDGDGRPQVRLGSGGARFETPGYEDLLAHEDELERQEKVRLLYVAATRARDHLVVSVHHKQDRTSHASRLLEVSIQTPELWRPVHPLAVPARGGEQLPLVEFDDSPERFETWREERSERIKSLRRVSAVAATEIARRAGGDPNIEKDQPVEEAPPWRRGRAGTALGRAVHAVLQSIDLATGAGLQGAARAQAAAEGIPARADEVARMAAAARAAPSVRAAIASGRYWREVYVAAPVEGVIVEGFIDLLSEEPDGLTIVDYKTDTLPGPAELDAAMERYRLQGATYALALQEALGRPVARCVFVFTQPSGAIERSIDDLAAAVAAARELVLRPEYG